MWTPIFRCKYTSDNEHFPSLSFSSSYFRESKFCFFLFTRGSRIRKGDRDAYSQLFESYVTIVKLLSSSLVTRFGFLGGLPPHANPERRYVTLVEDIIRPSSLPRSSETFTLSRSGVSFARRSRSIVTHARIDGESCRYTNNRRSDTIRVYAN